MAHPVESFCNTLARSRLLRPEEIRDLRQRWIQGAGVDAQNLDRFRKWLVATGALTEYQVGVIDRGNADQLFFGPYRILERIGKGRMAGVFKVVHETGQTVAIKVLPGSKAKDPQLLARFLREARLALRLKHPNIVRTFQTGEARGLHYLAMEYLEGETLDEVLQRRGKLPPAEAVRLVHQALMGLQQIHDQGLIHRDLKPANLILIGGQPDSTLQATLKILDIGTGKALFDETAQAAELTNEGDLLGTPEYMAPEQARDPRTADIRADIYSLGCVLYHTLAGRPPFTDANRVRLLVRHATETPRPVSEFNSAVPDGLDQILNWMLAKDPAGRYPTPERAAQALQVFLAAGSEVVPLEADARMTSYLQWLEKEVEAEEVNVVPVVAPLPTMPIAPPVPVAPVVPPPPPVPVAPQGAFDKTLLERPARIPPPPPRKDRPGVGRKPSIQPEEEADGEEATFLGLSRRDFMMLAIGVGGLAVLISGGLAVWAIVRSTRRRDSAPEEEKD